MYFFQDSANRVSANRDWTSCSSYKLLRTFVHTLKTELWRCLQWTLDLVPVLSSHASDSLGAVQLCLDWSFWRPNTVLNVTTNHDWHVYWCWYGGLTSLAHSCDDERLSPDVGLDQCDCDVLERKCEVRQPPCSQQQMALNPLKPTGATWVQL